VSAFLCGLATTDHEASATVHDILDDEEKLSNEAFAAIAEVLERAFIWFTDPHDRTDLTYHAPPATCARGKSRQGSARTSA